MVLVAQRCLEIEVSVPRQGMSHGSRNEFSLRCLVESDRDYKGSATPL